MGMIRIGTNVAAIPRAAPTIPMYEEAKNFSLSDVGPKRFFLLELTSGLILVSIHHNTCPMIYSDMAMGLMIWKNDGASDRKTCKKPLNLDRTAPDAKKAPLAVSKRLACARNFLSGGAIEAGWLEMGSP